MLYDLWVIFFLVEYFFSQVVYYYIFIYTIETKEKGHVLSISFSEYPLSSYPYNGNAFFFLFFVFVFLFSVK